LATVVILHVELDLTILAVGTVCSPFRAAFAAKFAFGPLQNVF